MEEEQVYNGIIEEQITKKYHEVMKNMKKELRPEKWIRLNLFLQKNYGERC